MVFEFAVVCTLNSLRMIISDGGEDASVLKSKNRIVSKCKSEKGREYLCLVSGKRDGNIRALEVQTEKAENIRALRVSRSFSSRKYSYCVGVGSNLVLSVLRRALLYSSARLQSGGRA